MVAGVVGRAGIGAVVDASSVHCAEAPWAEAVEAADYAEGLERAAGANFEYAQSRTTQ